MDFRRCLYGGRLCVGTTEGEGNHKGWTSGARHGFPPPRGQAVRGKNGGGRRVSVRGTIFRGNVRGGEGWGRATTRDAPTGRKDRDV